MVPVLEMQKMKRTFAEFIASERSLASSEPNIQNIIVEILSIFLYDETQNIIEFSNKFVHSLLKLFPMNFQSKR